MGEPQRGQLSVPLDDVAVVWVEADGADVGGFWAIVIGVLAGTGKPRSLRLWAASTRTPSACISG